ncbi:hypothetical protein [Mesorhizobium sp. M00.F.Ca.ET.217.01.1.1]|uniref:hypothetical protein n=1 Tax=Mesorhizobium sp. M00.F.Ca.ET.217.01.1.1 TaxID=2500529 RepID=UPI0016727271|nr:hypothetical protein [Mesorhizobium sp. M00.F.Ca.ET.217.01.1.1]
MNHEDQSSRYYYPVEGRTDGAITGALAFIAIIAVPALAYAASHALASWISAFFS